MLLKLPYTEKLLKEKIENKEFDSYAIYVKKGNSITILTSENINEDTYFDIASCGKTLVTTPLLLQAIHKGLLTLENTLNDFFVNVPVDKKGITIKQLLTHTSGMSTYYLSDEAVKGGREAIAQEILSHPLVFESGSDYIYSDFGMILLGFILEKVYKDCLENVFEKYLKKPMGYTRSKFNIAVNEQNSAICYRSQNIEGFSSPWDDEKIRAMGTSAGNGGQFFSLADIKRFANAVLNKDERLYPKKLFELAERVHTPDHTSEARGLGWLIVNEKYHQTGNLFPNGSFGHCGHTGQSIFFNREMDMCVAILTNATRFLNMRSGFKGYNYAEIMKMREHIHNEIYLDLTNQNLL